MKNVPCHYSLLNGMTWKDNMPCDNPAFDDNHYNKSMVSCLRVYVPGNTRIYSY